MKNIPNLDWDMLKKFSKEFIEMSDTLYKVISATEKGDLNKVKEFVNKGFDVHEQGDEAIQFACQYGKLDIVKFLYEKGADIHANFGHPLWGSALFGHGDIILFLLSTGEKFSDGELYLAIKNSKLISGTRAREILFDMAWERYPSANSATELMETLKKDYEKKSLEEEAVEKKEEYQKIEGVPLEEQLARAIKEERYEDAQKIQEQLNRFKKLVSSRCRGRYMEVI